MPHTKNILIVCRGVDELRLLSRIKIEPENNYIIASDDVRVHKAVKRYPWVDNICFIEKMESFYNVADDVIRFLEIINKWLESLGDNQRGIPKELLFFPKHVEGGMTTQRIQDLLLLIRSYLSLIDTYNINQIYLIVHSIKCWEDRILIQTTRSRNICINFIADFRFDILAKKRLSCLKTYAREAYYILNILRIKAKNIFNSETNNVFDKEVVIQLCSSANKHIAHTVSIMKALKSEGYNPVALCWEAFSGADKVKREDLIVQELEKWVRLSDVFASISFTFKTLKRALARKPEFFRDLNFRYQRVDLSDLLWPSVRFFLLAELAQRHRLMLASKRYFGQHTPIAIRFWTTIFPQATIPYKFLNKSRKPIIFYAPGFPYTLQSPYEHHVIPVDLVFAMSKGHKKKLQKKEFSSDNIVVTGSDRFELVKKFKQKCSPDQSRSFLGIPASYEMYIFYDPNAVVRGYLSSQEQTINTTILLEFAKQHPNIALIIKPHPGHKRGILESQIKLFSCKNVFYVEKDLIPYHCLNAADLIITKFSTIGLEALFLRRPVVSVLLDGEKRFKTYGDAAEYFYSTKDLIDLLALLISDKNYRWQWNENMKKRSSDFRKELIVSTSKGTSELVIDKLHEVIQNRYSS